MTFCYHNDDDDAADDDDDDVGKLHAAFVCGNMKSSLLVQKGTENGISADRVGSQVLPLAQCERQTYEWGTRGHCGRSLGCCHCGRGIWPGGIMTITATACMPASKKE